MVSNAAASAHQLVHDDPFNTLYLEIRFPAGAFESVDGVPVAADGVVDITVQARAGGYGFTLSPAGLRFTAGRTPTVVLSFGQYASFAVADGSPRYPTRIAYQEALALWYEVTPARWTLVGGSGVQGVDELGGPVNGPGTYLVAAPR